MFCTSVLQKYGKEQQQALAPPLNLTADNCNQLQGDIQTNQFCITHRLRCFLKDTQVKNRLSKLAAPHH